MCGGTYSSHTPSSPELLQGDGPRGDLLQVLVTRCIRLASGYSTIHILPITSPLLSPLPSPLSPHLSSLPSPPLTFLPSPFLFSYPLPLSLLSPRYIYRLAELHKASGNWVEAGFTLLLHAQLLQV